MDATVVAALAGAGGAVLGSAVTGTLAFLGERKRLDHEAASYWGRDKLETLVRAEKIVISLLDAGLVPDAATDAEVVELHARLRLLVSRATAETFGQLVDALRVARDDPSKRRACLDSAIRLRTEWIAQTSDLFAR